MQRSLPIDLLRAVAVLLVMGAHMESCPAETNTFFHSLTAIWNRGGWIGVDLFFVLSGFLVSGLLFREHEKHGSILAFRFLIRRGFKIYPGFWVLIGVTVVFAILQHHPIHPHTVASELLFLQNYRSAAWPHTWSLAVEEHFYLLLVIFLFWLSTRKQEKNPFTIIPMAFMSLAIVCLTLRVLTAIHLGKTGALANHGVSRYFCATHLRIDSLFFGVLLSYFYHYNNRAFLERIVRWRVWLIALGILFLAPAFIFQLETTPFMYTAGPTMLYLGGGALLCGLLAWQWPGSAAIRSLAYMGSHSYSVYLWHVPVLYTAAHWFQPAESWFYYFTIYLAGAVSFGIIMAVVVEFPMLKLRDRWFPSRGRPMQTENKSPKPADVGVEIVSRVP